MKKKPATPDPREHMLATYRTLRWALVLIGVTLPVALWVGGAAHRMMLQDSMSQYYHADRSFAPSEAERELIRKARDKKKVNALSPEDKSRAASLEEKLFSRPKSGPLRDWFVGALFILGTLLIVYKGFLPDEDRALNLAGCFAIGVALIHMPWGEHRSPVDEALSPILEKLPWSQIPSIHYFCAVLVFVSLAYVCFFCGAATLDLGKKLGLTDRQYNFFKYAYRVCGSMIIASPIIGLFVSHIPGAGFRNARVFFVEAVGVLGFALYWALKSVEIAKTQVDRLAVAGALEVEHSKSMLKGNKLVKSNGKPPIDSKTSERSHSPMLE